ncbi:MAG: cytochrome c biogenesis protein CcsA [Planctomycetes bacterium]|nr:cytochrome c biogenesis protein CcsA [Planctomycetota bacterium]
MATETVERDIERQTLRDAEGESPLDALKRARAEANPFDAVLLRCLQGLASLKLTIALFFIALLLVFFGTLAQHRKDIWQVVHGYFRTPLAYVEFQDLLPTSFFPNISREAREDMEDDGFYMPGGWLIGTLMALNLLAAHTLRFKLQARGERLYAGLGVIGIGALATWLVIASGSSAESFQSTKLVDWPALWALLQVAVGLAFAGSVYLCWRIVQDGRFPLWAIRLALTVPGMLGGLFIWLAVADRMNDSGMRILWQLLMASVAAGILLAGSLLAFKKRAGVVVLHAGIAVMMLGEIVADSAVEASLVMDEGQTMNYAQDIRTVELAVVDVSPTKEHKTSFLTPELKEAKRPLREVAENVVVVPRKFFDEKGEVVRHDALPFHVETLTFYPASRLEDRDDKMNSPADKGAGLKHVAREGRPSTGTDDSVDMASAYVRLIEKKSGKALGAWLVSQWLPSQPVTVDGRTYEISLRFKRNYKLYSMTLLDMVKRDYLGTTKEKDYSSHVRLRDPRQNVDRKIRIWMNNPLRYAGETFYQSSYHPPHVVTFTDPSTGEQMPVLETDPETGRKRPKVVEGTVLQVVENTGWMIPYTGCMIVAIGMLAHFLLVLTRFLNRRAVEEGVVATAVASAATHENDRSMESEPAPPGGNGDTPRDARSRNRRRRRPTETVQPVGRRSASEPDTAPEPSWAPSNALNWLFPMAVVLVFGAFLVGRATTPRHKPTEMDLYAFGRLPIAAGGRTKPMDTLARSAIRVIGSGKRESFTGLLDEKTLKRRWSDIRAALLEEWDKLEGKDIGDFEGDPEELDKLVERIAKKTGDDKRRVEAVVEKLTTGRQPAIRWLLDVIARPDWAARHKVFYITTPEILQLLNLEPRSGFLYSIREFQERFSKFEEQAKHARMLQEVAGNEALDRVQRKVLQLDKKFRTFTLINAAFTQPALPPLPDPRDIDQDPQQVASEFTRFRTVLAALREKQVELLSYEPPLAVPVVEESKNEKVNVPAQFPDLEWLEADRKDWEPYTVAWTTDFVRQKLYHVNPNPPTLALQNIFVAYADGDVAEFNKGVAEYQQSLRGDQKPEDLSLTKTNFEAFYNHFAPFLWAIWMYLAAFVFAALGWLGFAKPLNRASTWLIVLTLGVHTFALVARIYISGRPPVTNLYSSAVFIGWGAVCLGLLVERIYRLGIGNMIASVSGFATLWIAWLLAGDGDTFTVLQAVLDTNFWLATHVTCITLGYATTFVAGLLGLLYVIKGLFTPRLSPQEGRDLARMTYGTLCFAIFFSFVGTVLGGLWADDSWGRFWGWDPKENGALMIVLWNALVLHARWDKLVKEKGLAVLAIGGNIVTAWSWFGVNELGVGLHSYGFTEGVLATLFLFVVSQAAMMIAGSLPRECWWSFRRRTAIAGSDGGESNA